MKDDAGNVADILEVPWRQVIGMRHVIVHGYDMVRLDIVASVIERDLVPLRQQIAAIRLELA